MNRRMMLLAAGVAAVLVVGFWFAAWSPATSRLKNASARLGQAQALQTQLDSQVVALRAEEKHVGGFKQQLAELSAEVPKGPSLDTAIDQLTAIATAAGVGLPTIDPGGTASTVTSGSSATPAGPPSITLQLSVSGSYSAIRSFLERLDATPRLFVTENLTMAPAVGVMSASMELRMFYSDASLAPVAAS